MLNFLSLIRLFWCGNQAGIIGIFSFNPYLSIGFIIYGSVQISDTYHNEENKRGIDKKKCPILGKTPADKHPIEWVSDLHAEFESIHPFIDGNGLLSLQTTPRRRTGRIVRREYHQCLRLAFLLQGICGESTPFQTVSLPFRFLSRLPRSLFRV